MDCVMRKFLPLPPQKRLLKLFRYEPRSGLLYWRVQHQNVRVGASIGEACRRRGVSPRVMIDGKLYYVSRIIWKMQTGVDPKNREVDHRDLNRLNDRWGNLRLATPQQNGWNHRAYKNNKLGVLGVNYHKGKFQAKVRNSSRVLVHLGYFNTVEEASAARSAYVEKYRGDFARVV